MALPGLFALGKCRRRFRVEVDALEAARLAFACRTNLFEAGLAIPLNDQREVHLSNLVGGHVECSLDDGAL